MNETIRQLCARKSTRAFEQRPISPEDKALILEAAAQAPTAGNQQLYTIIDVTDQAIKDRLVDTCDGQPFIAKAPMVLISVRTAANGTTPISIPAARRASPAWAIFCWL